MYKRANLYYNNGYPRDFYKFTYMQCQVIDMYEDNLDELLKSIIDITITGDFLLKDILKNNINLLGEFSKNGNFNKDLWQIIFPRKNIIKNPIYMDVIELIECLAQLQSNLKCEYSSISNVLFFNDGTYDYNNIIDNNLWRIASLLTIYLESSGNFKYLIKTLHENCPIPFDGNRLICKLY